jgi:hypothetical protein
MTKQPEMKAETRVVLPALLYRAGVNIFGVPFMETNYLEYTTPFSTPPDPTSVGSGWDTKNVMVNHDGVEHHFGELCAICDQEFTKMLAKGSKKATKEAIEELVQIARIGRKLEEKYGNGRIDELKFLRYIFTEVEMNADKKRVLEFITERIAELKDNEQH